MAKVVIAMSGGVDSSVAAALLKRAGFNVVGVFMKFWKPRNKADYNADLRGFENRCCTLEAERRARKVAKILKIPFYVFNFEKEFKKKIVDYFLKEHKAGRTPNPCVVCNKEIKFGLLLEKALKLDADFVATGHYARLRQSDPNLRIASELSEYSEHSDVNSDHSDRILLKAKDKNKDQSYFLWMLNQKQLKKILFPIGDYTRKEVENLAKKFKLPVLKARKSVEICFIQTTIDDFLKKYLKENPGKIIDTRGETIGTHQGLYYYTIGQRKGLGLVGGPAFAKATAGKPYYVLDKDLKKNLLIVTKNEKDLYKKELTAKNVNWISGKEPKLPLKIKAKIRYRSQLAPATIYHPEGKPSASHGAGLKSNIYHLKFEKPQRAITPGQSVVFYSSPTKNLVGDKGQELLGGGIIG